MDLDAAKTLIESREVQKYLDAIDKDTDSALKTMKSVMSRMKGYPPAVIFEYRGDAGALEDAQGAFNAEVNKITFKKAKDGKALMEAYRDYALKLGVLEEQNVRFEAYVQYNVASQWADFIAFVIEIHKVIRKQAELLVAELQDLDKQLKEAKSDVTEAEVQRAVNVVLTAVSLLMPQVGLAAGIGIAAATLTVQIAMDEALGPGKPGAMGIANSAAGDIVGLPSKIKPAFTKFGGAASGLITLKMDSDEVDDARKIVDDIKERLRAIVKKLENFMRFLEDYSTRAANTQKLLEKTLKQASAAAEAYRSAENRRLALLKELGKLK